MSLLEVFFMKILDYKQLYDLFKTFTFLTFWTQYTSKYNNIRIKQIQRPKKIRNMFPEPINRMLSTRKARFVRMLRAFMRLRTAIDIVGHLFQTEEYDCTIWILHIIARSQNCQALFFGFYCIFEKYVRYTEPQHTMCYYQRVQDTLRIRKICIVLSTGLRRKETVQLKSFRVRKSVPFLLTRLLQWKNENEKRTGIEQNCSHNIRHLWWFLIGHWIMPGVTLYSITTNCNNNFFPRFEWINCHIQWTSLTSYTAWYCLHSV